MRAALILASLLCLGATCSEPPIAIDSGCVKLQRKDFTDKGLYAQSAPNKAADLGNETWWLRDCGSTNSGLAPGPR